MQSSELQTNVRAIERLRVARQHGLEGVAEESLLAGETERQFRERLLSRITAREMGATFSLRRIVEALTTGQCMLNRGLEAELCQEVATQWQIKHDPRKPIIPWVALARDLTVASAGAGGFLVATGVGPAVDVLRPWSVTARAGVTVLEGLRGNETLPRTTTKATGFWVTTEGTAVTESTPALGQIALLPHTCGAVLDFSRQLSLQAATEPYWRRELLRTVGTLWDQGTLNGSGAGGQPTGLLNTTGVVAQSGTTLSQAGVTNMKQQCATANANDEAIVFITTPEVRELLENREKATGNGGFVWQDDKVADRRGYVTTDMPTATMVAGDWSDIILALWGPGFEFSVNPYEQTKFAAGITTARVLVSMDVAVQHPSSFCASSSIT